jgi:hypothetical protein
MLCVDQPSVREYDTGLQEAHLRPGLLSGRDILVVRVGQEVLFYHSDT